MYIVIDMEESGKPIHSRDKQLLAADSRANSATKSRLGPNHSVDLLNFQTGTTQCRFSGLQDFIYSNVYCHMEARL